MGSDLDPVLAMRAATAAGRVLGPRIFAAGPILDDPPGDWPLRLRVKTAANGRAAVRMLAKRGVDLIKVHDNTPRAAYFAIAETARRLHLRLAGHVPAAVSVDEAIAAGQHDIEHLSNLQLWKPCSGGETYDPEACRSFFEQLAKRHVWQTPTLVAMSEVATVGTAASRVSLDQLTYVSDAAKKGWALNQSYFATPAVVRELQLGADVGAAVTKDMAKLGVGILAGCDMMIAGFCVADELDAMVRGGMPPLVALQTATLNPARYFDRTRTLGSVAPGRAADLVLLEGNPLTDIGNVRRIRAVILAGQLLDRKALDRLLAEVRAAAATQP
jgi:imidazolonepropionase-like amidohydrolase